MSEKTSNRSQYVTVIVRTVKASEVRELLAADRNEYRKRRERNINNRAIRFVL